MSKFSYIPGKKAENLACNYLIEQGLRLKQHNFHSRFGEIDLIMWDKHVLVFIEVKLRSSGIGSGIEIIALNFKESIQAKQQVVTSLEEPVFQAVNLIVNAFKNGNKMLICGNGGSAADSQHFAAEFTGRYEMERKPLPAIALTTDTSAITAIGNDYSFEVIFSKQVEALGNKDDILFAISTSGNSKNIIKAIEAAKQKQMRVITLTGKDGGKMIHMLNENDVAINSPVTRTARIQETHLMILHTLCDAVDNTLFK